MNKVDVEKALASVHKAERELDARREDKRTQRPPRAPRLPKPIPRMNVMPHNLHPDDWEPDDEGDRGWGGVRDPALP